MSHFERCSILYILLPACNSVNALHERLCYSTNPSLRINWPCALLGFDIG